jgi:hypothetical protein
MNFYLMWANHDATTYWDVKNPRVDSVYWDGEVDREQFNTIVDRVITQYFKEPSYLKIEGEPVFCIYELNTLINGLGGSGRKPSKQGSPDYIYKASYGKHFPRPSKECRVIPSRVRMTYSPILVLRVLQTIAGHTCKTLMGITRSGVMPRPICGTVSGISSQ